MRTAAISLAFTAAFLSGCALFKAKPPQTVTVVAPAGPATSAESSAITSHLATVDATMNAVTGALSKVSASAGAIRTINGGQPAGPRTTGVDGEAGLILSVAGPAAPADQIAAAERARIVAEGKSVDIAAAYNSANLAAQAVQKALGDTQMALGASNSALAKAKADALAEQATQAATLQNRVAQMQRDADARVAAAQAKAEADQRKLITWIFFGGGALCFAAGLAILIWASSVPIFGPKAGMAVMGAGGGLILIGMVMNELAKHPWVLWTGIVGCFVALAVAAGLIISNHAHAIEDEASKAVAAARTKLASLTGAGSAGPPTS